MQSILILTFKKCVMWMQCFVTQDKQTHKVSLFIIYAEVNVLKLRKILIKCFEYFINPFEIVNE